MGEVVYPDCYHVNTKKVFSPHVLVVLTYGNNQKFTHDQYLESLQYKTTNDDVTYELALLGPRRDILPLWIRHINDNKYDEIWFFGETYHKDFVSAREAARACNLTMKNCTLPDSEADLELPSEIPRGTHPIRTSHKKSENLHTPQHVLDDRVLIVFTPHALPMSVAEYIADLEDRAAEEEYDSTMISVCGYVNPISPMQLTSEIELISAQYFQSIWFVGTTLTYDVVIVLQAALQSDVPISNYVEVTHNVLHGQVELFVKAQKNKQSE